MPSSPATSRPWIWANCGPGILVGHAFVAATLLARRALSPDGQTRVIVLLIATAAVMMTVEQDGHGFGIVAGAAVGDTAPASAMHPDDAGPGWHRR